MKKPVSPKLLIDGDIIIYQCGFKADSKEWGEERAVQEAKWFVGGMLDYFDTTEATIYLTGKDNFREKVAVTHPYKGNRKDNEKPKHYNAIKQYLIGTLEAVVVDGAEADDALGQNAGEGTIICSTDKDLNQIPGWHYNWRKNHTYRVSLDEGRLFFLHQMLVGDYVDNIKGVPGVGEKKSAKKLSGLSYEEGQAVVRDEYKKAFGVDWEARLKENAQLLWIRR